MPKVQPVLPEQLNEVESKLKQELAGLRQECQTIMKAVDAVRTETQRVGAQVGPLSEKFEENVKRVASDGKSYTDEVSTSVQKQIQPIVPNLEEQIGRGFRELEATIQGLERRSNEALEKQVQELRTKFSAELAALQSEMIENFNKSAETAAKEREVSDSALASTKMVLEKQIEPIQPKIEEQIQAIVETQKTIDKQQDERAIRTASELQIKIDQANAAQDAAIKEAASRSQGIEDLASGILDVYKEKTDRHLAAIEEETTKIRDAIGEVENTPTRRVEWVIDKVTKKIRPVSAGKNQLHSSFFSPRFDAAGAHGMQLELAVYRPAEVPVEGQDAGDCSIYLWACKGVSIVFRIYIGTKSATLERVFNGRVPYGASRICFLKDQIDKTSDELRIGVEFLEVVRNIERPIEAPKLALKNGYAPGKEPLEGAANTEDAPPLEGWLFYHRHINNRQMELIQTQVDLMRSRMIKRIEWRVEQANMLKRCFPVGSPVCSPTFVAAGLEGMQLVFYPSGYNGATEGFCSLFLYCPAGATLRCWLWVGKQRREASHSFDEPGAFGRTNYCRFDAIVDESDNTILIALDIDEAHQDVRAHVAHPTVTEGEARSQAQLEGMDPGEAPRQVESVVKLQRSTDSTFLKDVKQLPSLWTCKPMTDAYQPLPQGFKTFSDMRSGSGTQGAYPGGNGPQRRAPPAAVRHASPDRDASGVPSPPLPDFNGQLRPSSGMRTRLPMAKSESSPHLVGAGFNRVPDEAVILGATGHAPQTRSRGPRRRQSSSSAQRQLAATTPC